MNAEHKLSTASQGGRRKSVAEEPVTSVLSDGEVPTFDRELTADEEVLAALGYKYAIPLMRIGRIDSDIAADQSSSASSHCGRRSVSHLLFSAYSRPLLRHYTMAWDMQEHLVWSGDG